MESPSTSPRARTPRQRFWLRHLEACRAQKLPLKVYARKHRLSVSALYAANSALKRREGAAATPTPSAKATFVPVRLTPPRAEAVVRVRLPNGVVVELPESIDPRRCEALLASIGALR